MVKRKGRHVANALDVKKAAALIRKGVPGRYFDGNGLHLFIKPSGSASWVLRTTVSGKRKDYGLGPATTVHPDLAAARDKAHAMRKLARSGGDPAAAKRAAVAIPSFEEVARLVHDEHKGGWRNAKHRAQWLSTLERFAFPQIGKTRVDLVDVPAVLGVLAPIWLSRVETAKRLRQRMRVVIDYADAKGWRSSGNPVGSVLTRALPKQTAVVRHHPAIPYSDVPAFYDALGRDVGNEITKLALRLLILTATRSGEVRGARRSEFDLEAAVWTIPGERMKMRREHRVPLSVEAVAVVRRALELSADSELVFPGVKRGAKLSDMTLLKAVRRICADATPHGFRSSFSDWCAEATGFSAEVREMALAHSIGSKTEAAYRRGDLFKKRADLMTAWARYITASSAKVVELPKRQA